MEENTQKYRHELKYIISSAQLHLLKSRIENIMIPDTHACNNGMYSIRSLYFDDYNNQCFYENENGTDPREKLRMRIYNHSPAHISLECKRKERGKTLKTAAVITEEQALKVIEGIAWQDINGIAPILNKMKLQMDMRLLRPVIIVEYDRIPYVYPNGNVRITFDLNVSSSCDLSQFWEEKIPKRPVMPPGTHLMEVKFDEFLPDFIYHSLNLGMLRQTAFSKYYLCRKYSIN